MTDDTTRDEALGQALKAADEIAAALQAHLVEQHGADPDPDAAGNAAADSLRLLGQARQRIARGLRITGPGVTEADDISLRRP